MKIKQYFCALFDKSMNSQLLQILLCNIPAYICAGLALWRKLNNGQYYEAVILFLILVDLFGIAWFTSLVLEPITATDANQLWLHGFAAVLIPLIHMFHAPAGGEEKVTKTTLFLFALVGFLFVPASSIELVPAYATRYYTRPMDEIGVSIFYRGVFQFHVQWIVIILLSQALVSLVQLRRAVRFVHNHGAKYSKIARAVFVWDFNCGFFLAAFYVLPLSFWQQPTMRWIFIIMASIIIAVGCFLIFLGFDLNPISDDSGLRTSVKQFVADNGELINKLRVMLEDEKIYLERGIQAETLIRRLGTNNVYFDRVMEVEYGMSFPEYVHRARMAYAQTQIERARRIPASRPLSVDRLAAECGYEDTSTFLHLYQRITGNTLTL